MTLMRFSDPFAASLHGQLDDMFSNFWKNTPVAQASSAMDVYTEDDKQLVAEVQAPGFDKDDIEVKVHDGVLEIKGEKHDKQEQKDKNRNYVMRESHSSFYRSVALPKTADGDKVEAHFEAGMLKVTVPLKELPASKKVAIQG